MASGGSHSDRDSDGSSATLVDLFLSRRRRGPATASNRHRNPRVASLVWARAFPCTWWPGVVTRATSTSAFVSFFGCGGKKSRWFRVSDLCGFEERYPRFAKMGGARIAGAVAIALDELSRRTAAGLIGRRHRHRSPEQEMEGVTERFEPVETLVFVRGLAVSAWVGDEEVAGAVRMSAEVYAYWHFVSVGRRCRGGLGFDSVRVLEFVRGAAISVGVDEDECGGSGGGFGDFVSEFRRFVSVCPRWSYRPLAMDLEDDLTSEESEERISNSSYVDEIDYDGTSVSDEFCLSTTEMDSKTTQQHLPDDMLESRSVSEIGYDGIRHLADDFFSDTPAMESKIIPQNLPEGGLICFLNKADYSLLDIDEERGSLLTCTQAGAAEQNGSTDQAICLDEEVVTQNLCSDLSTQEMDLGANCTLNVCHVRDVDQCFHDSGASCAEEAFTVSPPCSNADSPSDNVLDISNAYHITQLGEDLTGRRISATSIDTDNQSLDGGGTSDNQLLDHCGAFCAKVASIVNRPCSNADSSSEDISDADHVAKSWEDIAEGNISATGIERDKDGASSKEASAVNLPSSSADSLSENVACTSNADLAAQSGENLADGVADFSDADHIATLVEGLSDGRRSVTIEIERLEAKDDISTLVHNEDTYSASTPPLHSVDNGRKLVKRTDAYANLSENATLLGHSSTEITLVQNNKDPGTIECTFPNSTSSLKNTCSPVTKKRRCSESLKKFFKLHRSLAHSKEAKLYASLFMEYVTSTAYEAHPYDEVISESNVSKEASFTVGPKNDTKLQFKKRHHPSSTVTMSDGGGKKRRCSLTLQDGSAQSISCGQIVSPGSSKWRKQYASPLTKEGSEAGSDSNKYSNCPKSLHMKFPKGFDMPSREEIKKKFRAFGKLDRSRTKLFLLAGSAQVVFLDKSDARAACEYAKRKKLFGDADVRFWLDPYEASRKRPSCDDKSVLHKEPLANFPQEKSCADNVCLQKEQLLSMKSNSSLVSPDVHSKGMDKMECQGSTSSVLAPTMEHSSSNLKSCLRSPAALNGGGTKRACRVRFRIET